MLLRERHEGYITWEQYGRNRELITANNTKVRGAPRQGRALLAGLLLCGRCTRRMQVQDNGRSVSYRCRGENAGNGGACQGFGGVRADAAGGEAPLAALQPVGVEAALRAWEEGRAEGAERERLARSTLEEARWRAQRAEAQLEAVEPANLNVFRNRERKLESCLAELGVCEQRLAALQGERQRWSGLFRQPVGEFKVDFATSLNYRPSGLYRDSMPSSSRLHRPKTPDLGAT